MAQACDELSLKQTTLDDINQLSKAQLQELLPEKSMAICYGPAWVFGKQVIAQFHFGMFNINAIPIPHYLGGAHYTWQLLNKNRQGGCFFQQITQDVDQGDIYAKHEFSISEQAITPDEYFIENIKQGKCFIEKLAEQFKQGSDFSPTPYSPLNKDRLYLPRLRTDKQGYINWQWCAEDIISFCQGFDSPYIGAASFLNNKILRFKNVKPITLTGNNGEEVPPMHPFCAGLIVRKTSDENSYQIVVAAQGGFISLDGVFDEQGDCAKREIKRRYAFTYTTKILDEALAYQVVIDGQGFKD